MVRVFKIEAKRVRRTDEYLFQKELEELTNAITEVKAKLTEKDSELTEKDSALAQ